MKKFGKMVMLTVCTFFLSMVPTFARELNLKEFVEEVEKRQPNAGYVYIIGEYIFTSNHELTVQDVMFAANSIDVEDINGKTNQDDIYGEMTISYIEKDGDDWVVGTPEIGDTQIELDDEKAIHASYIDYDYLPEPAHHKVTFDSDNEEEDQVVEVLDGRTVSKPTDPVKEGYKFAGWYLDDEEYEFTTEVHEDITLKAHWKLVINTDEMLKEAVESFKSDKYTALYDDETGNTTFDILDEKELLSKVTGTGLVSSIRKALQSGHIKAITVNYDGTDYVFDDASMDVGQISKAYQKLLELLDAMTDASKETAKLGDLIGKNLTLTFEATDDAAIDEKCKESYAIDFIFSVSTLVITLPTAEDNKKTDEFIGYKGNDSTLKLENNALSGTVKYHTDVYFNGKGNGKVPGYYASIVLQVPHATDDVKLVVNGKTLSKSEFDTKDSIIVVIPFDRESEGNQQITVKVDADGNGTDFTEKDYTIDCSGLTFERDSVFSLSSMDGENEDFGYGWHEEEGYSTKVEKVEGDKPTYKVTGVLPIFDEQDWDDDPFDDNTSSVYYLGLRLKLEDVPNQEEESTTGTYTVKFFHDGEEDADGFIKLAASDFAETNEIYLLIELTPFKEGVQKNFDIKIDIDGAEEEFKEYTVTVDWSELKFQDESRGAGDFDVIKTEDLGAEAPEKAELTSYGYNEKTDDEVTVKMDNSQEDQDPTKEGLQGSIREQTLKSGFTNNTGYFVPIKIVFPQGEEYQDYKNTWTLILNTEGGSTKEYKPTEAEYAQGWVMVLFRLNDTGDKKIKYSIDFDGSYDKEKNTGAVFLPYEYEISYDTLTFKNMHEVSFDGIDDTITVWDGDSITEDILPEATPKAVDDYHEFAYWNEEDGTKFDTIEINSDVEDITLVPHWNIYSDEFISDVIADLNSTEEGSQSPDFSEKFIFERDAKDGSKITIRVIDADVTLNEMNTTSIPGAIAYILLQDEIQEISLEVNGTKTKTFTKGTQTDKDALKADIQKAAQELYKEILTEILSGKEDTEVTLAELAEQEGYESFTLKINPDKVAKTVTLAEKATNGIMLTADTPVPLSYTFTFVQDDSIKAIKNEEALKTALADESISEIVIAEGFEVDKPQEITRNNITITSSPNNTHTLTGKDGIDTIFDIKGQNVTISNLHLSDTKTGITVENGASVTANNVSFDNASASAIARISTSEEEGSAVLVKGNGSFTGSNLTYTNEKYMKPLVKAENGATVSVTLADGKTAQPTTVEEVVPYVAPSSETDNSIGEVKKAKEGYGYKHYYLNSDVANRWIKVTYIGNRAVTHAPLTYTLYHDKEKDGEYLREPEKNINYLTTYSNGSATYTISKWETFAGKDYETGKIPVSEITGNEATFSAELTATYKEHVKRVENEDQLKAALQEEGITTIIVANEIDLTSKLEINKEGVIISGTESGSREITGTLKGQIEVKANKVVFSEIKIVGSGNEVTNGHVVTISGKEFDSSESEYSVESGDFDSILYYDVEDPDSVLFYNTFSGNGKAKTYIEFSKEVDGNVETEGQVSTNGSSLTGNYFKDDNHAVTFIKMKAIKNNTKLNVRQTEVVLSSANAKFIELDAKPSGSNVTLNFGSLWVKGQDSVTIYVNDSTVKDASGITIQRPSAYENKIKVEYTKTPGEGKSVIFKS